MKRTLGRIIPLTATVFGRSVLKSSIKYQNGYTVDVGPDGSIDVSSRH